MDIFNLADELQREYIPPEEIISGGILDVDTSLMLTGPAKGGKSFLAIWLIHCLATATRFLLWDVPKPRRVLYLQMEIGKQRVRGRFHDLARTFSLGLLKNVWVITDRAFDISEIGELVTILKEHQIEVLVIDPLYLIHGADEDKNSQMKQVLKVIGALIGPVVRAVVLVHHQGHAGKRARGASTLLGWPDTLWNLEGESPDRTTITGIYRSSKGGDGLVISLVDDPPGFPHHYEILSTAVAKKDDEALEVLTIDKGLTTEQVGVALGRDRTTANRRLLALQEQGLTQRVEGLWYLLSGSK